MEWIPNHTSEFEYMDTYLYRTKKPGMNGICLPGIIITSVILLATVVSGCRDSSTVPPTATQTQNSDPVLTTDQTPVEIVAVPGIKSPESIFDPNKPSEKVPEAPVPDAPVSAEPPRPANAPESVFIENTDNTDSADNIDNTANIDNIESTDSTEDTGSTKDTDQAGDITSVGDIASVENDSHPQTPLDRPADSPQSNPVSLPVLPSTGRAQLAENPAEEITESRENTADLPGSDDDNLNANKPVPEPPVTRPEAPVISPDPIVPSNESPQRRFSRLLNQARDLASLEDLSIAQKAFRDLINEFPKRWEGWHGIARLYEDAGEWKMADYFYSQAVKISPKNAVVYNDYGWFQITAGKYTEAYENLTNAVYYEPKNTCYLNNLGVCLCMLKRGDAAVEFFKRANGGNQLEAYCSVASVSLSAGNIRMAASYIDHAYAISPDNPKVTVLLEQIRRFVDQQKKLKEPLSNQTPVEPQQ